MSSLRITAPILATAFLLPEAAFAAPGPVTRNTTAEAIVLDPAAFIDVRDLDFGTVIIPSSGTGSVTVPADGTAPIYTSLESVASGVPLRGRLIGAASPLTDVAIESTLPTAAFLNGDTLSDSIPLSLNFDLAPTATGSPSTWTYTTDSGGTFSVYIGGTLSVPSTAVSGSYSATFDVTATYP